jgi:hypothetical protein
VTADEFSEVDFDLLADYVGGALDGTPEHASVAGLIENDSGWRAAHDELEQGMASVGTALGEFGAIPEPMPSDVSARLENAFAAEASVAAGLTAASPAAGRAETSAGDGPEPDIAGRRHLTVVPDEQASGPGRPPVRNGDLEKRGRRLRWAAPIAVAAAVIAFVGFGADYLAGRDSASNDSAASSSAGQAENAPLMATDSAGPGVGLPAAGQIHDSGTDYRASTLAGGLPSAASKRALTPDGAATDSAVDALARLRSGPGLLACLQAIAIAHAAGAISVTGLDYARFEGTPALVVQFTASDGKWAWASGADCGSPAPEAATLGSAKVG